MGPSALGGDGAPRGGAGAASGWVGGGLSPAGPGAGCPVGGWPAFLWGTAGRCVGPCRGTGAAQPFGDGAALTDGDSSSLKMELKARLPPEPPAGCGPPSPRVKVGAEGRRVFRCWGTAAIPSDPGARGRVVSFWDGYGQRDAGCRGIFLACKRLHNR